MANNRLVIFSVAGAPYRDVFYRLIAEKFGGPTIYAKVLKHAPDHAWSGKSVESALGPFEVFLPAFALRGRGLFKSWRVGRNPLVIPTFGTWRAISEINADTVVIQEYSPVAILFAVWARLNSRMVVTMTDVGRGSCELSFLTRVRHWVCGYLAHAQLAHTVAACDPICPSIEDVCFSPHSIDVPLGEILREKSNKCARILFVGNLIERKGVDLLLKAILNLLDDGHPRNFTVRLVGGGDSAWLDPLLGQLKDLVELAGFKEGESLAAEYRNSDVFVLPSRYDTFGVVGHEAASHGLALLLSRNAGCSELFGNRENVADIFDPADIPSFSRLLARLIDDGEFRRASGEAAKESATRWSAGENARRVVDWLSTLSKETKPSDSNL